MTRGGERFTMSITPSIPVKFVDNNDGTYTGSYNPPTSGTYKISVQVGGKDIKGSPWTEQH